MSKQSTGQGAAGGMMAGVTPARPVEVAPPEFSVAVSDVLTELKNACAAFLDALPQPIYRAVDLERQLKLDKKLAWQVFRIARADHPISQASKIPAASSVRRLMEAARRREVAAEPVKRLERAFASFESAVERHAGDRETFASLVSSLAGEVDHDVSLKHRRALFRANAHLWGIQTDANIRCEIFHPSATSPHRWDTATINGYFKLHRLRPGASPLVTVGAAERGDPVATANDADDHGLPILLEQFSSGDLEHARWVPHAHLDGHAELQLNGVGRAVAVSFHTLVVQRAEGDAPRKLYNNVGIATPTSMIVCDVLVPAGMTNPATARLTLHGSRSAFPQWEVLPENVLPHDEQVRCMPLMKSVPDVPEAPQYVDAVNYVLRSLGWDSTLYDVYRCHVAYPYFHTMVQLSVDECAKAQ